MHKTYGFLFLTLLTLLLLPSVFLKKIQNNWVHSFNRVFSKTTKFESVAEDQVILENQILKSQITYIQEWIFAQQKMDDFILEIKKLEKNQGLSLINQDAQKKRLKILGDYIALFGRYAIGTIIFKEPFSSSSFAWLNVGELYNQKIGNNLIQKNSPVVVGDILVGIVEEVFLRHSKIRMVTDPNLVVAVRAIRGKSQSREINRKAYDLLDTLELSQDFNWDQKETLKSLLAELHTNLEKEGQDRFYAKGEVYGAEFSPFYSYDHTLIGDGFQMQVQSKSSKFLQTPDGFKEVVIKRGDLLETTGLDGIFPKGLKVAIVTEIAPSKLGRLAYKIKAKSLIEKLQDIQYVQILPPILDKPISS